MAEDEAATRKRKAGEVRTICLLLCPMNISPVAAVLYKFNIEISSQSSGKIAVLNGDEDLMLSPIATFFENYGINSVGCCVSGSKLFLVPNESKIDSLCLLRFSDFKRPDPVQFDFLTDKTLHFPRYPHALKLMPLVFSIRDKVYALSRRFFGRLIEPSFEMYDPTTLLWEPLPQPLFYKSYQDFEVCGYAVVTSEKGEVFIIVVGTFPNTLVGFFSYKVSTDAWKPVSVVEDTNYPMWTEETVVVGGHIYAYTFNDYLEAFSIHCSEETDEISAGRPFKVYGLKMRKMCEKFYCYDMTTGAIGKIGDQLLCVVHTSFPRFIPWQYVIVSIVKIRKDNLFACDTLSSFMVGLPNVGGGCMNRLLMTSCFVLEPYVSSIMEQAEEARHAKHQSARPITDEDYLPLKQAMKD